MDSLFLISFFPEIFLSFAILYQLLCNARLVNSFTFNFPIINNELLWQGVFIFFCLMFLSCNQLVETYLLNFLFISDFNTIVIKIVITFFALLAYIFIWKSFVIQKINFFEYFSLFLLSLLGVLLLVSSYDLISIYLVIELQALSFYILACFRRTSSFSTESGLKYFILGSFISGLFLLGSFFIYASLGTLNLNSLSLLLYFPINDNYLSYSTLVGVILITVTLFFKTAAAPFHFWAPDVYEGAPLSSTLIFSIIPKIAIFTFFIRWVALFINVFSVLKVLFIIVGIISVFWGAYLAIAQKRFKRFIIYSSISQTGFAIIALSVYSVEAFSSVYFFLIIYLITSVILWGTIVNFHYFNNSINTFESVISIRPIFLSDLSSYFKVNYVWSLLFLIIFFSFAGIPPFSGFLSKVLIIFNLVLENNLVVSVILILVSIVSSYYYLKIIKTLFFEKNSKSQSSRQYLTLFSPTFNIECTIMSFCLFLLLFLFFSPSLLLLLSNSMTLGYFLI